MANCVWSINHQIHPQLRFFSFSAHSHHPHPRGLHLPLADVPHHTPIYCNYDDNSTKPTQSSSGIQLYGQIERLLTDVVRQSQDTLGGSKDWSEIEVQDLPTFGIGHSLGSVIHLLIGSRYAVQRNGNILMAFNNKSD